MVRETTGARRRSCQSLTAREVEGNPNARRAWFAYERVGQEIVNGCNAMEGWPMLRSAVERPTLLIAASNEAWTAGTRVPAIQHACVRAWARLFGLPLISAINS